jgi:hypothetical protein
MAEIIHLFPQTRLLLLLPSLFRADRPTSRLVLGRNIILFTGLGRFAQRCGVGIAWDYIAERPEGDIVELVSSDGKDLRPLRLLFETECDWQDQTDGVFGPKPRFLTEQQFEELVRFEREFG